MSEESKNKSVFRQGNAGEEQTAENLNEYIRTGSAGGYFLIAALIIVVVALFIWGFVGKIPVNITETSVVTGTTSNADLTLCFVDVKKKKGEGIISFVTGSCNHHNPAYTFNPIMRNFLTMQMLICYNQNSF